MAKRTITRKHLKTVTCAYIYTDGHAVLLHRESWGTYKITEVVRATEEASVDGR